jgi:hypothetical protein
MMTEEKVETQCVETQCGSCGMPVVLSKGSDPEGYYCPKCVRYWTRDPLSKAEKKDLKEPLHIAQIRKIVTEREAAGVKCPVTGKRLMVDGFSANAIIKVYDALSDSNKQKLVNLSLLKVQAICFKLVK